MLRACAMRFYFCRTSAKSASAWSKSCSSSTVRRPNDSTPVYREQYNPDLTVPDSVVEEWIAVGTFRAKEKITAKPQVVDWSFAEKARGR